jgi:hypothetical protein
VKSKTPPSDRRQWQRLPLAIPVFVRSQGEADKELLEFATALNVSAGGMLLAVRRSIPCSAQVSLEIPSSPVWTMPTIPKVARTLRARVLRMHRGDGYNLVGLKFSRPLLNSRFPAKPRRRKVGSPV